MINLKRLFRTEYTGEEVIITRTLRNQVWETTQQYFPFDVELTSGRVAAVIGNGLSRKEFNLDHVFNHPGGFENEQKIVTYSCNAAHREFISDYLIVTGNVIADEVKDLNRVIYANAANVIKNSRLHLIPQNPFLNAGAAAAYIAAFDGHKKVFMLGFDGQDTQGYNNNVFADTLGYDATLAELSDVMWVNNMKMIFDTYYDTQFIRVMPSEDATVPESWKYCLNFKQVDFRGFVLACNL